MSYERRTHSEESAAPELTKWIIGGVLAVTLICVLAEAGLQPITLAYLPRQVPPQHNIEGITLLGLQGGEHGKNWRLYGVGAGCVNDSHSFSVGIYTAASAADADYPGIGEDRFSTLWRADLFSC